MAEQKVSQEVILRSTGIIVGKGSAAYKDLERALKSGADPDWLAAKTSFDLLTPETREKIRLHAESYARLIADDEGTSKTA
jgi:hypothetical protein